MKSPSHLGHRDSSWVQLAVVEEGGPTGPFDRRHGIALDAGAVSQPAQPSADHKDRGQQAPHAETYVAPPGPRTALIGSLAIPATSVGCRGTSLKDRNSRPVAP